MNKVMLVDDEMLIREHIKHCIDWKENGFEIAVEASNGIEALQCLKETYVDLVLVDINMPCMDGLEFMEKCKKTYPHVMVVILTGYSDFAYVKKALEVGALGYLLKPIDEEELINLLAEATTKIETKQKAAEISYKAKSHENDMLDCKKIEIIKKKHTGKAYEKEEFEHCFPQIGQGTLYVIIAEIKEIYNSKEIEDNAKLWNFAVLNISKEILSSHYLVDAIYDSEKKNVIIIVNAELDKDINLFMHIQRKVKKLLSLDITFGFSHPFTDVTYTSIAYKEAIEASKKLRYCEKERCLSYPDINIMKKDVTIKEQLIHGIRFCDAKVTTIVDDAIDSFIIESLSIHYLANIANEIILAITNVLTELNIDAKQIIPATDTGHTIMENYKDIHSFSNWCHNVLHSAIYLVKNVNNPNLSWVVNKAKTYIDNHYSDNKINLIDIATALSINPSYLSSIFKNELGLSIVAYITKMRMEKAKKLIEQGQYTLQDISVWVGYNDVYYFSKCFKKSYGISGTEYAKRVKKNKI